MMEKIKNNRLLIIAILVVIGVLVVVIGQFASMARTENNDDHPEGEEEQMETANPQVVILTNHGSIKIELLQEKSPVSVKNFLAYADQGFYQETIFHRVIPGFMIQGGGFNQEMEQKKPTMKPIINEADNGIKNRRGTLAMARTMQVDSATSQFFINLDDNEFLDHGQRDFGYAVFGRVIKGMTVVDKIAGVATGSFGMHQDVPEEPVVIKEVKRITVARNDDQEDCGNR